MRSHHRSAFGLQATGDQVAQQVLDAVHAQSQALAEASITVREISASPDTSGGSRVILTSTFDSADHPQLMPSGHRAYVEAVLVPVLARVADVHRLDPHTHQAVQEDSRG